MSLMEKFAKLTPEQREKLDSVNDEATLVAFAAENSIELTEQDKKEALAYFENGVAPMSDDDMEAVAGGAAAKKSSPEKAAADGRTVPMPTASKTCICHHENKWAREEKFLGRTEHGSYRIFLYSDIKCYKCNQWWKSLEVTMS